MASNLSGNITMANSSPLTTHQQQQSSSSSTATMTSQSSKSGSMKRTSGGTMNITKELEENIATMLGPNVKIRFKAMLKLELKAEKLENRLLAFSQYRLFMFLTKGGTPKLENSFNYVDINLLESRQPDKMTIGFRSMSDSRHLNFHSCDPQQEEINVIICHLVTSLKTLFPHVPFESFIKRFDVEPRNRLENVFSYVRLIEEKVRFRVLDFACGGFSNQYACFCDYYGVPFREEVAWDIDTIYAAHNNTELSILDFEHLDLKDLLPLISALTYNGYFTKFRVSNVKIVQSSHSGSDQICEQIVNLVRRSTTLEEIYLDNTGIKADFVNKLFQAMLQNNQTSIQIIDLSNNSIEDKGLKNMTSYVAKSFHMANNNNSNMMNNSSEDLSSSISLNFSTCSNQNTINSIGANNKNTITSSAKLMYKGLIHLNLSHCGITSKGISELSESLYLNKSMFSTLTYLNLSDNNFKDDLSKLLNFLAQPNNVAHLDLSGTDCNLESVFGALFHGCTNNLVHLNLSRNQFSTKKSSHKDLNVPVSIKKFFSTAIFLRTINLSHNKLPTEALKAILLGLACNESAADIRINLSSNEFKSNGAAVLELSLTDIRCVSGLDLSDNSLDMDLINVVNAIAKNKSIKYLSIGRNFNNIKAKHLPKVLDSFVQMLQDPDCSIESLSLIDSKLRSETSIILNALGSNQSLINIDISGNLMGLLGAKTLAKALQVNNHLETIYLDRNVIPTAGFIDIAYAMERNYTLKYFHIPIQDVQQAMIKMLDRTEAAVNKIQEYIHRNNLPQTVAMRTMRIHSLNNSHISVDSNLFTKIEKITLQLQTMLREKSSMLINNNRMSSLDSIDLSSSQDKTITSDHSSDYCVINEDLIRIENLLSDVQNMRSLFLKVQELYSHTQSISNNNQSSLIHDNYTRRFSSISAATTMSRPIETNIIEISKELKRSFETHINQMCDLMIQCVKEEFPHVFMENVRLEMELKELCKNFNSSTSSSQSSSLLPSIEYFQLCLTESCGIQWSIKLEQILNTIASQLCNKVLLEMNRCLTNAQQIIISNNGYDSKSNHQLLLSSNSTNSNNNHIHSNGMENSIRSLTPDIILRNPQWFDSGSSQDSTDLLNAQKVDGKNPGENNAIATPKLGNPKRQNNHVRKLRPQSVLDGSIIANEDFPDLYATNKNDISSPTILDGGSSLVCQNSIETPLSSNNNNNKNNLHLTKMRPRNPKTRAPTRVTIVDPNNKNKEQQQLPQMTSGLVVNKIDEGLDNFFPTVSLLNNSSSITSIESSKDNNPELPERYVTGFSASKPQPQPRKILRKLGFKSQGEQSSSANESQHQNSFNKSLDKSNIKSSESANTTTAELVRSTSPVIIVPRRNEHVSICNDNELIHNHSRVHSPLPGGDIQQHNELLAEMKAMQEKRSYNSTPVNNEQTTFASSLLEKQSSLEILDDNHQCKDDTPSTNIAATAANSNSVISVAKRATMFGDLHKSPSKHSINQSLSSPTEECNEIISNNNNINNNGNNNSKEIVNSTSGSKSVTSTPISSTRQRPKSIVGMLGAKFELSIMNSNSNK